MWPRPSGFTPLCSLCCCGVNLALSPCASGVLSASLGLCEGHEDAWKNTLQLVVLVEELLRPKCECALGKQRDLALEPRLCTLADTGHSQDL